MRIKLLKSNPKIARASTTSLFYLSRAVPQFNTIDATLKTLYDERSILNET
jgi:hypothetical protein